MFDRNPASAWVYSGTFSDPVAAQELNGRIVSTKVRSLAERSWIHIERGSPIELDEIRIMNGYNKDRATFSRNARIMKLDIYDSHSEYTSDRKPVRSVSLSDTRGWHSISLPKRRYAGIKIVVKEIARGTDPDVAISELELRAGGENVGPPRADYFLYSPGDE
jgi:hypothetical protein